MTTVLQAERNSNKETRDILHPLVKEWFFSRFKDFSPTQEYGVLNIWNRRDILISAPTGSTKTLTAFLSILNYLVIQAENGTLEDRIYAIYTSPLKALSNDIHKNLVEPLEQIKEIAEKKGIKLMDIRVGLRTGDTTQSERAKMARKVPHIFVTTPESLAITLTSPKFVENMKAVEFFIIDEIHALDNKRGTYLSLTMERLNEISQIWPTKIGLSATIEPMEEVGKYLVGEAKDREVLIARVQLAKKVDVEVLTPTDDLIGDKNVMPNLYMLLGELIGKNKTTLIFTNTRSATERIVSKLKETFPTEYGDDNIAAHHSSLSKDHRFDVEERLRNGELKVVVCSTSLELGIDIGSIDLVIMIGSPKSSARALQRLGRAGHKLNEVAKGRFIVTDRDDLVECSVIQKEMIEKKINKIKFPRNCLDVLAQQIYGMAIYKIWNIDELFDTIKKSYCYSDLTKKDYLDIISYLAGEYDLEKNHVYGKIWYDPETKQIGKRGKMARVMYMTNIGTIPEESFITVKLTKSQEQIGFIDEGFMERMKKGDVFVLGGRKYQFAYSRSMNLYVNSAEHLNPTIPSWFSEMLPLSFDSGLEINKFRLFMKEKFSAGKSKSEIQNFVEEYLYVNKETAKKITDYFYEQFKFLAIPTEKTMIVERYKGEKKYLIFHSMYGRRVNDALSRALGFLVGRAGGRDIEIGINDNGFYLAGESLNIDKAMNFINVKNMDEILQEAIEKTDVLARRFRHCAGRALMILRNYKGNNKTVGKQQMKSHFLLYAVKKITNEFPILREARREVLEDLMDIQNAKQVIGWIKNKKLRVEFRDTIIPSPFATNLILQGQTDLMRMEDKQDFLKRMHKEHLRIIQKKMGLEY